MGFAQFNQSLSYSYSGNISSINWQNGQSDAQNSYAFTYDKLKRLKTATHNEVGTGSIYNERYDYDNNGNITKLVRTAGVGMIDSLYYEYSGNKLVKITDNAPAATKGYGFVDGANSSAEYEYNLNGAANKDLNRGVQSISFNLLNLPKVITQGSVTTTYTYDAAGNKLKVSTSGGITTDYISNKQYSNGVLDKIMIPQGYIQNGQYYYFTLDYLGNVRVISNSSGTVIEQNDYYPYGMRHENSSHIVSAGNRYKFSGKEVETTGNLSTLDFGWRQYDPQIGRWSVYDTYSELYSSETPYAFVGNNPVNYYDPNGKEKKKNEDQNPDEIVIDDEERIFQLMKYLQENQDASINDIVNNVSNIPTTQSGNSLYIIGMILNGAGFVASAGEYYNVIYGSWKGANGVWYPIIWGGNQWTGARSTVMDRAGAFKLAGRAIFVVGAGISLYQGGDALLNGNYATAAKSGLDIAMGALATFGGPAGWLFGGGYFLLDAIGTFDRSMIIIQYILPTYPVRDNTYVVPPIIKNR